MKTNQLPRATQIQPRTQTRDAGPARKSEKAQAAAAAAAVQATDRLETEDAVGQVAARPSKTSPLAEAVLLGLEELANKYYGGPSNAKKGIELLAQSAGGGSTDSVISKEFLDMRARSLAKEVPELGQEKAKELLANIALLLVPPT